MRAALLAVVVLILPGSAAPVPKELKKKPNGVVGVWVEVGSPKSVWFFNEDGTAGTGEPDKPLCKAIFKTDDTQSPPHLDWSQDGGKSWYLDAYELDGDTLKLSAVGPGGVRPATVDPKNGSQWIHLVRREKSK